MGSKPSGTREASLPGELSRSSADSVGLQSPQVEVDCWEQPDNQRESKWAAALLRIPKEPAQTIWQDFVSTMVQDGWNTQQPPIPTAFRHKIMGRRWQWSWGTHAVKVSIYSDRQLWSMICEEVPPLSSNFAHFAHAGHGINSWALGLVLSQGPLTIYSKHRYGGVYGDADAEREAVTYYWRRLDSLLDVLLYQRTPWSFGSHHWQPPDVQARVFCFLLVLKRLDIYLPMLPLERVLQFALPSTSVEHSLTQQNPRLRILVLIDGCGGKLTVGEADDWGPIQTWTSCSASLSSLFSFVKTIFNNSLTTKEDVVNHTEHYHSRHC